MSYTSTFRIWAGMLQRCCNPNNQSFRYYGGRGIQVCDRWFLFENFLDDMGIRPKGLSIDRVNNERGYSPENCRWATQREQRLNSRRRLTIPTEESRRRMSISHRRRLAEFPRQRTATGQFV